MTLEGANGCLPQEYGIEIKALCTFMCMQGQSGLIDMWNKETQPLTTLSLTTMAGLGKSWPSACLSLGTGCSNATR